MQVTGSSIEEGGGPKGGRARHIQELSLFSHITRAGHTLQRRWNTERRKTFLQQFAEIMVKFIWNWNVP